MIGFGALLPVLPLFVQEQGIDATQLGLIVAAWPIAKLISEPIFGWWADRHSRKPQMVIGLVILGIVSLLPLFFTTFAALFILRFIAGAATGLYDPAARGMLVDATDEDERGEAFGFYAAFQVGGFAIGPAIGALGTALFGGYAFPFIFTGVLAVAGAAVVALYLSPRPHVVEAPEFEHRPRCPAAAGGRALLGLGDRPGPDVPARVRRAGSLRCHLQPQGGGRARADLRPAPLLRHLRGGLEHLSHRPRREHHLGGCHLRALRHPRDDRGPHRWPMGGSQGPGPLHHRQRPHHPRVRLALRPGQRAVAAHAGGAAGGGGDRGHDPGSLRHACKRHAGGPRLDRAGALRGRPARWR